MDESMLNAHSMACATTTRNATLSLAELQSAEHLRDLNEESFSTAMKTRPLRIHAYALDDPSLDPSLLNPNKNAVVKVVHFVRHGQGFHNFVADMYTEQGLKWKQHVNSPENPYTKPELLDAPLTEKGRMQAVSLQSVVASLQIKPELVVSSPLCRALSTCSIAFQSLLPPPPSSSSQTIICHNNNAKWVCHELAREENGAHICDRRRCLGDQMREFPMFDFSLLETDEDILFDAKRRETKLEVAERVYKFLEWMSLRQEINIGLVSHSCWLMTLFNGVVECCDQSLKAWFQTGEIRSVVLVFSERDS